MQRQNGFSGVPRFRQSSPHSRPPRSQRSRTQYLEKAALEAQAQHQIVAVAYDGCHLRLLPGCGIDGHYAFTRTTPSTEEVLVETEEDLYAKLPLGAVKLGAEIRRGSRLEVRYAIVGQRTADRESIEAEQLVHRAECAGATHWVHAMVVGAYELSARDRARASGGAELPGVGGGGGRHEGETRLLRRNGNRSGCVDGTVSADSRGCQALVRLELVPVRPLQACPPGMAFVRAYRGGAFVGMCIDRTEVTVTAFAECVRSGKCSSPVADGDAFRVRNSDSTRACNWGREGRQDHPINCIDVNQATDYCSAAGKALPTYELLRDVVGDNAGNGGRQFPWGNDPPSLQLCWSGVAPRQHTCAVGAINGGATPEGIEDLHGNVSEWTTWRNQDGTFNPWGMNWRDASAPAPGSGGPMAHVPAATRLDDLGFRCSMPARDMAGSGG